MKSKKWPGSASVYICNVHLFRGQWTGTSILDEKQAEGIDSFLDPGEHTLPPYRLTDSAKRSHTGTKVYGDGFILTNDEGQDLLSDCEYRRVVKPYLIGKELNEDPYCKPSKYIIDFTNMGEEEARAYPRAWTIVEQRVREARQSAPEPRMRDIWWQFQRPRLSLYRELHRLGIAWLISATSETFAFVGLAVSESHPIIFSHAVNVLTLGSVGEFAGLQSSLHSAWARRYGGSLKQDFRYTTTDCLENFPFPENTAELDEIGELFHSERSRIMQEIGMGLTAIAGAINTEGELDSRFKRLRDLQVELDCRVLRAYGAALDLGHGFHETRQGRRFTISPKARATVLDLLLALNHERHEAEQQEAPAPKRKVSKKPKRPASEAPLLEML